jgi:hypothetical protein
LTLFIKQIEAVESSAESGFAANLIWYSSCDLARDTRRSSPAATIFRPIPLPFDILRKNNFHLRGRFSNEDSHPHY